MKTTKRTFTMTALSLLLCFCMVFGLTACGGFTQDDIDKAVNDATTPLNEQITALEADIAEKTTKITTLESEKAALVTEKGELEADITSLEAEKAALEDDKAELEDEVETLEAEKKALTDENTELEASITSKNAEIATLTSSVSSLEAEKTTLNGRVSELNAQITTLNERIADLEASGETDGAEITELKAKVSTLEGEKITLSARVTELEGTIEDKNAEITDLEDDVATLTTDKAALEGQITSLNGTITAKNNDIANLNSSISALETEKANLEEQVTTLNASISAKETEIANLNSSIATLTAEKQALTDRVTALENENAALKNCVKGNHVAGTYSTTETTHTYTCIVCGTEVTEEHEYIEGACVCGKSEIAVSVAVDFYIGGVELLSEDTAVSEGVLAYYQNGGTVKTTEPTNWNAKLEYSVANGFTLTLNNLSASSGSGDSSIPTRSGIYVESAEPLTIIVEGTNELNVDVFGDGIHSTSKSLTISGSGSLQISDNPNYGINVYNSDGSNISITSSEISFSGWGGSCIGGTPISVYDNATVLVGDSAETATTWDGTTHWSNYKFVTILKAEIEESNVTDMKNTLYNGNTYTLQNNLTLSENASVAATGKTPVLNLNEKTIFTNNYSFKCLSGDFTINGNGSFFGNYAKGGILDVQGTNAALRLVGDVTLTNTAEDGYHITWHSSVLDLSGYTGNALMIKNISSFAQETFTIILPDGWKLYHGDGTAFAEGETIAANEIVTADLDVEAKWGTSVDDLTNGGSLAEALASNAVYIQLRQNVTLTDRIEVAEGVTLTFDFNGYTVTAVSNKDGFYNNGTLTLLNGEISDSNSMNCAVLNKGTLTMTDVVINGGNPLKQTQGTATLTRCALTQTEDSFYYNAIYAEGGTISATDSSFSADRYAIWVCNTDLTLKGTVSLTYGTTTQNCGILLYYGDLDLSLVTSGLNGVDVTVGGSTAEPTTVMLPDGYEAKDEYSGDTVDLSGSITSSMIVELVSAS